MYKPRVMIAIKTTNIFLIQSFIEIAPLQVLYLNSTTFMEDVYPSFRKNEIDFNKSRASMRKWMLSQDDQFLALQGHMPDILLG
ncbi:hypothetical protein GCM10010954_23790 [Halobacillus andaensis]|uniref:Uncharacterized protein n=1 Tax=Halobacillus andaensis TaxID=1176239 RepID=A0A917B517_HALAA|nr:hypothetical protein GCM10010954_23790 [Halobacillus andaensis]